MVGERIFKNKQINNNKMTSIEKGWNSLKFKLIKLLIKSIYKLDKNREKTITVNTSNDIVLAIFRLIYKFNIDPTIFTKICNGNPISCIDIDPNDNDSWYIPKDRFLSNREYHIKSPRIFKRYIDDKEVVVVGNAIKFVLKPKDIKFKNTQLDPNYYDVDGISPNCIIKESKYKNFYPLIKEIPVEFDDNKIPHISNKRDLTELRKVYDIPNVKSTKTNK